jgi:hypothetical protein
MTDLDPMDARLRAYAGRWREAAAPAPAPDVERLRLRRSRRSWWLAAASAAATAAVIVGATRLVGGDAEKPQPPPPAESVKPAAVPWAALPPTNPRIPTARTPASPDPAEAVGKPACRASDLRAQTSSGGAAGTRHLTVRLMLVGESPCTLEGYPALQLLDHGRPARIPVERNHETTYRHAVLVSAGHPALLELTWVSDWCAAPVDNDSVRLALTGGFVTFPGLGGSACYGTPGSGSRAPVLVKPFQPIAWQDAKVRSAYADVQVTGDLDLTTSVTADVDFTVTLTSAQRLVLAPCPDYRIIRTGDDGPVTELYALNCRAVPYHDGDGRPYLPAGTPVRFAMHTVSPGDAGLFKLSWMLDTVDARTTSGTLTVSSNGPTSPGDPSETAQQKAAVDEGARTLQAFLDVWRRDGFTAASHAYAAADRRSDSDVGTPRLRSGSVLDANLSSWESPDHFTLEVSLDLHFVGDPVAWNEGENGRFVTVTRTDGALRLSFATSP